MGQYISQTGGSGASGALTYAIGNERLAFICPASNGTVSTSVVAAMITKAEAEANSILGPVFSVPILTASVQEVVKMCVTDIAIYRCYQRVTEFRNERGEPIVRPDYDNAVKTLKELRSGERDMGSEATTSKSAIVGGTVYSSTHRFIVEQYENSSSATGGF